MGYHKVVVVAAVLMGWAMLQIFEVRNKTQCVVKSNDAEGKR